MSRPHSLLPVPADSTQQSQQCLNFDCCRKSLILDNGLQMQFVSNRLRKRHIAVKRLEGGLRPFLMTMHRHVQSTGRVLRLSSIARCPSRSSATMTSSRCRVCIAELIQSAESLLSNVIRHEVPRAAREKLKPMTVLREPVLLLSSSDAWLRKDLLSIENCARGTLINYPFWDVAVNRSGVAAGNQHNELSEATLGYPTTRRPLIMVLHVACYTRSTDLL